MRNKTDYPTYFFIIQYYNDTDDRDDGGDEWEGKIRELKKKIDGSKNWINEKITDAEDEICKGMELVAKNAKAKVGTGDKIPLEESNKKVLKAHEMNHEQVEELVHQMDSKFDAVNSQLNKIHQTKSQIQTDHQNFRKNINHAVDEGMENIKNLMQRDQ